MVKVNNTDVTTVNYNGTSVNRVFFNGKLVFGDFPQSTIQASDKEAKDNFGYSVAIYSNKIIVGSPLKDIGGNISDFNLGAAYIFDTNGNQLHKLQASDREANDYFGYSVAIDGDKIVVGALYEDTGASDAGAAYIFDTDGNQLHKIQASDRERDDSFGSSVAISGNIVVVGAPYEDTGAGGAGAAYIFDTNGNQLHKLQASDKEANDNFGYAIAISGDKIVIGAPYEDTGGSNSGAAYIFDTDGNQLHKLVSSNANANAGFGLSVAIKGDKISIGAPNEGSGFVYIFNTDGKLLSKLSASNASSISRFGSSVNISDDLIVVSAYVGNSGTVYAFNKYCSEVRIFDLATYTETNPIGTYVAIEDNNLIVGAPGRDDSTGVTYIIDTEGA